jgi:hypothetical protein
VVASGWRLAALERLGGCLATERQEPGLLRVDAGQSEQPQGQKARAAALYADRNPPPGQLGQPPWRRIRFGEQGERLKEHGAEREEARILAGRDDGIGDGALDQRRDDARGGLAQQLEVLDRSRRGPQLEGHPRFAQGCGVTLPEQSVGAPVGSGRHAHRARWSRLDEGAGRGEPSEHDERRRPIDPPLHPPGPGRRLA